MVGANVRMCIDPVGFSTGRVRCAARRVRDHAGPDTRAGRRAGDSAVRVADSPRRVL